MSLLGLLEDAPVIEVPEVPVWSVPPRPEPGRPLSAAETVRWNETVRDLGGLSVSEAEIEPPTRADTPIWDKLSAQYRALFGPAHASAFWDEHDWIAADFERTWAGKPMVEQQLAPPAYQFLDAERAPPPGFRSPISERRDRSGLADGMLRRVLAGLRHL